jgi:8-oxo-dGTP diphosphatase
VADSHDDGARSPKACESGAFEHVSESIAVGIGLVLKNGAYLARLRPEGSPMPHYWEFPGGKCEPEESPEAATRRECAEEIGFEVAVQRLRSVVPFIYPHGRVTLYYHDCVPLDSNAEPGANTGFRWIKAADLPGLLFPPANEAIVSELAAESRDSKVEIDSI